MAFSDTKFFTHIEGDDWSECAAILDESFEGDVCAALDALFARGVPVNGAHFVGDDANSILDLAWWVDNVPAMLHMLDKLPGEIGRHDNPLCRFCAFAPVIDKLLQQGGMEQYLQDTNLAQVVREGVKPPAITLLARAGMDLDVPMRIHSSWEQTAPLALLVAVERGADVLDAFAGAGADLAVRDHLGNTLIHCLTQGIVGKGRKADVSPGQVDQFSRKIGLALDAGVPIDARNDAGDTALHIAARFGFANKARVLIGNGASIQAETVDGVTPAAIARSSKKPAIRSVMQVAIAHEAVLAVTRSAMAKVGA